jgi:hypothetical protein
MKTGLLLILLVHSFIARGQVVFAEPTRIDGSVFIVMKNGENVKLALAPIYVVREAQFKEIQAHLEPKIKAKNKSMMVDYLNAEKSSNYEKESKLRKQSNEFIYESYMEAMGAPLAKSDADGKFSFEIRDSEPRYLACRSQRRVVDETEEYYWFEKFEPQSGKTTIAFSNDNLLKLPPYWLAESLMSEALTLRFKMEKTAKEEAERRAEIERKLQIERSAKAKQKALELNLAQAEKGDPYGQFRMGERYLKGEGVERNMTVAKEWLKKASANGHSDAQKLLESIKRSEN